MVLSEIKRKRVRNFLVLLVVISVTLVFLERNLTHSVIHTIGTRRAYLDIFETPQPVNSHGETSPPPRVKQRSKIMASSNGHYKNENSKNGRTRNGPRASGHFKIKQNRTGGNDFLDKRGDADDTREVKGTVGKEGKKYRENKHATFLEGSHYLNKNLSETGGGQIEGQKAAPEYGSGNDVTNFAFNGNNDVEYSKAYKPEEKRQPETGASKDGRRSNPRREKLEGLFNNPRRPVRTTVKLKDDYVVIKRSGRRFVTKTRLKKSDLDIMNMMPLVFDPRFKNPCWYGNSTGNDLFNDTRLHCLPYFYLIGVKKSATTDLFYRMARHPQFIAPELKEAQWFPRLRFKSNETVYKHGTSTMKELTENGYDNKNVTFYIGMYNSVANTIERRLQLINQPVYSPWITGDATPANLHLNPYWEFMPGNENLSEPKYTNLNYIQHLNPNAKIIIIFRDPVTRLYSDFLHMSHRIRVGDRFVFHHQCTALTSAYTECFRSHTPRECVYNNSIVRDLQAKGVAIAESFLSSFYAVYIKDIYNLFDNSNVLPILTSEYISNTEDVLNRVFKFLGLGPMSRFNMEHVLSLNAMNQAKRKSKTLGPMLPETKNMLYNFFTPFNRQMAELMGDDEYMFKKPEPS